MKTTRTGIVRFMARFTASKLCPSVEKGSEEEQMVNMHLWYVRAFIIREKIIKAHGQDLIRSGREVLEETKSLSASRFIEFLESLEYAIPGLVNDDSYHIEVAECFENRHLYREALLHYQKAMKLNPKQIGFHHFTAEIKRKLGDPTWEQDRKIADDYYEDTRP